MKRINYKEYVAGWLDTTVHDFVNELSVDSTELQYCLIACLDSNPNPASILRSGPELKAIASETLVIGTGLLLPTERLLKACRRKQVFFGFDELWFFPGNDVEPKPDRLNLLGPARVDQRRLRSLGKWMDANTCSFGIGGGEGLNFVIRATGPARDLLGHSIVQTPHTITAQAWEGAIL